MGGCCGTPISLGNPIRLLRQQPYPSAWCRRKHGPTQQHAGDSHASPAYGTLECQTTILGGRCSPPRGTLGPGWAVGRTTSNCSSSTSRSSRRWGGGCWRVAPLSEKSHAGTSEGVSLRTRVLRTEKQEGRERVSERLSPTKREQPEGNEGPPCSDLLGFSFGSRLPSRPPASLELVTASPASQPHTRWTGLGRASGALLLLSAPPSPRVSRAAETPRLTSLPPPGRSLRGERGAARSYLRRGTPPPAGFQRFGEGAAPCWGKPFCRWQAGAWQADRKTCKKRKREGKEEGKHGCRGSASPTLRPGPPFPRFGSATEPHRHQWGRAGCGGQRQPRALPAIPRAMGKQSRIPPPGVFRARMGKSEPLHGIM